MFTMSAISLCVYLPAFSRVFERVVMDTDAALAAKRSKLYHLTQFLRHCFDRVVFIHLPFSTSRAFRVMRFSSIAFYRIICVESENFMKKNDLTVIVLAKNEEKNIGRCLESVRDIADRIVVVDSGSTDSTVKIAKDYGADVFFHEFINYAEQFNWALDNVAISTKWVFRFDADEEITPELKKEIVEELNKHSDDDMNAFIMKYKIFFLNKFLKHGGAYPFKKITIFKYGHARFEKKQMNEHVYLLNGRIGTFKNDCLHYDFKDLDSFVKKHNWYATREVGDYFDTLAGSNEDKDIYGTAKKAKRIKHRFYYKLPLFFRARLLYIYKYYFKFGFLDGKPGKIYALIQTYFYRTIVDSKIYEKKQNARK